MKYEYPFNPNHKKDCPYQAYPLREMCNCKDLSHLTDMELVLLQKELRENPNTDKDFFWQVMKELKKRQIADHQPKQTP